MRYLSLISWCSLLLASPALAQVPVTFSYPTTHAAGVGGQPQAIAVADVNGDSRADILLANNDGTAGVLLGRGNGSFTAATTYATGSGSSPTGIAVADLNGDGMADILTANSRTNEVGVLPGLGAGTFGLVATYSTGPNSSPQAIAVADVNSDGRPDMLSANSYSSTAGVMLTTATGIPGPLTTYSVGIGSHPQAIAVADVNGDGWLDVLTSNSSSSTAGVLLGTATGTFNPVVTYSTGTFCQASGMAVVDVNGDSKPDLLVTNYCAGTVGVLLGTGAGQFGSITTYSTGTGSHPCSLVVTDINADGLPDLLTANSGSDSVGLLLGTGTGTFGAVTAYSTGAGSAPKAIAVADVNRDGRPDLLTASYGTSAVSILFNTTTPLATRASLPAASATLHPNPAYASTTITATNLPAAARTVAATLLSPIGQEVRRFSVPATLGTATATVPTTGLASGLYLLQLSALDAQDAVLGTLPVQRLAVE